MSLVNAESANVTVPAVGSEWEQQYPAVLRGVRVRVTAVTVEEGVVRIQSEEVGFPGARAWLDLKHWVDFFRSVT